MEVMLKNSAIKGSHELHARPYKDLKMLVLATHILLQ